ncbi:unnamed protein product [Rhodiola kirilowii]
MQLVSLVQAGNAITHDVLRGVILMLRFAFIIWTILPKKVVKRVLFIFVQKKKRAGKKSDPEINGTPVLQQSLSASWFSSKSPKRLPFLPLLQS